MKTIFFILLSLLAIGSAQASANMSSAQRAHSTNEGINSAVVEPLPYACFAASSAKPCETYTLVITTIHGVATIPNINSQQNCMREATSVRSRRGLVEMDAFCVGVINGR